MSPLLSATDSPFPTRAWLTWDLPQWVFACLDCWGQTEVGNACTKSPQSLSLKAHGCFSHWERCSKVTKKNLPWLSLLLCNCILVFPKLNCRWKPVVINSVERHPHSGWIFKQCEHTQEALLDLLYFVMSSHSYDVNKSKPQHTWLQH